jgi:Phage integrase family
LAMGTGFRANELRTLTREAFALDADPPSVTVKAAYSKRRREDVQPIREELAAALRPWLAARPAGTPIFGRLTEHTADMLRHDLEAAGIAYETDSGTADFHCLRHSYVSALAMSNAPVKILQTLARHSTPALTLGVYAHVGLFDQAAALDALPDLTRPEAAPDTEANTLAATGTDGVISKNPSLFQPYGEGGSVRIGADACGRTAFGVTTEAAKPAIEETPGIAGLGGCVRSDSVICGTEGVGFEPTDRRNLSTVFKTVAPPDANPDGQTGLRQIDERLSLSHPYGARELPPELAEIVAAWDRLPQPVRDSILMLVRAGEGVAR